MQKVFEGTKFVKVFESDGETINEVKAVKLNMYWHPFVFLAETITLEMLKQEAIFLSNEIIKMKDRQGVSEICKKTLEGLLKNIIWLIDKNRKTDFKDSVDYPDASDTDLSNLMDEKISTLSKFSLDELRSLKYEGSYKSNIFGMPDEIVNEMGYLFVSFLPEKLIIKMISGIIINLEMNAYYDFYSAICTNGPYEHYDIYFSLYKIAIALFINLLTQKRMKINALFDYISKNTNEFLSIANSHSYNDNSVLGLNMCGIEHDYFDNLLRDFDNNNVCNMFLQNFCYISNAMLKNGLICKNNLEKRYVYMTANNSASFKQNKIYTVFVKFIDNKSKELSNLNGQMPPNYLKEVLENPEEVSEKVIFLPLEEKAKTKTDFELKKGELAEIFLYLLNEKNKIKNPNEQNQKLENSANEEIKNNSNQFSEDNNEEITQNNLKSSEETAEKVEEKSQNEQNQQLENSTNEEIQNNSNQLSENDNEEIDQNNLGNNQEISQNNISSESVQEEVQNNSHQLLENNINEEANQSASSSRNNQEMPQVNVIEQNEAPAMEEPKCNCCVIC